MLTYSISIEFLLWLQYIACTSILLFVEFEYSFVPISTIQPPLIYCIWQPGVTLVLACVAVAL
jgi:hypothetical protein